RERPNCCVESRKAVSGRVIILKRIITNGSVVICIDVVKQRKSTDSIVKGAIVAVERCNTDGRIGLTGSICKQGAPADGRVAVACISNERLKTDGRVLVGLVGGLERLSPNSRVLHTRCKAKESLRTNSGVVAAGSQAV